MSNDKDDESEAVEASLLRSRNDEKTEKTQSSSSSTSDPQFYLKINEFEGVKPKNGSLYERKIDHILISFDQIDLNTNTIPVTSSEKDTSFKMKIVNRTDIFKGIKNGAVYLHSKTNFVLSLEQHDIDFCLTSSLSKLIKFSRSARENKKSHAIVTDLTCSNGWTVSFWVKVSSLNLFDKTILKVDNLINQHIDDNSKFFVLKLSNFDIKIQFLYKRKLWTVSQNLIWKSEWTMLTFTWSEFEGITIFVNEKKMFCQQAYEYYSIKEEFNGPSSSEYVANLMNPTTTNNNKSSNAFDHDFDKFVKRSFSNYESSSRLG
jgi:hypothetical protein